MILFGMLAACAPAQSASPQMAATNFPMEGGLFTSAPETFLLNAEDLGGLYTAADAGSEIPNSVVIESRTDGQAYVEATGRLSGHRIQFNREAEGDTPTYIINVVNSYKTAKGAQLTLSRDWNQDVWSRIDSGELTLLPEIPDLDAQQLIWQDANGTVGVEIVYRNLYLFFTGPIGGGDAYQFFTDLAKGHVEWIKTGE
jgi:hypothetical protein